MPIADTTCECTPIPPDVLRRSILLTVCILGVVQYGMVLTNGVSCKDFNNYYGISEAQGDLLYTMLNFGACALSFLPGLIYDRLGCTCAMIVGTLIFDIGIFLQLSVHSGTSAMYYLTMSYALFGFACSFFNVIGCFAPLVAYPSADAGKVSACVQVFMSLGITINAEAYFVVKSWGGDYVWTYLICATIFTNICGALMCFSFWICRGILSRPQVLDTSENSTSLTLDVNMVPDSLQGIVTTVEFTFMFVLFFGAIGFSFCFLNSEARIAAEVGIGADALTTPFGILNALGRLLVSVPLDFTRRYAFGGVFVYITASLLIFMAGVLSLALPDAPGPDAVYLANVLVSLGYGGLLGIVPPALRLLFGTTHLGLVYGMLYIAVAISEPLWALLLIKTPGCIGVRCYSTYYQSAIACLAFTSACSILMALRDFRRRQQMKYARVGCTPLLHSLLNQ